jgi:hypothetical protein
MAQQTQNRTDMLVEACMKLSSFSSAKPEKVMAVGSLAFEALDAQAGTQSSVIIWAPLAAHPNYHLLQTVALALSKAKVKVEIIGMEDQYMAEALRAPTPQGNAKITFAPATAVREPSLLIVLRAGIQHVLAQFAAGTPFITTVNEAKAIGAAVLSQASGCVVAKLLPEEGASPAAAGSSKKMPVLPPVRWTAETKDKLYYLGHGQIARYEGPFGVGGDVLLRMLEMEQNGQTVKYFPSATTIAVNMTDERRRGGGFLDDAVTMQYKLTKKMREYILDFPGYIEAASLPCSWVAEKMTEAEQKALKRKLGGMGM